MNLYIRYFDEECVVNSAEEAFDFLSSLSGVTLDEAMMNDLREYIESPMPYPKRYKVRPRVYFIVIKTTATTLAEFKMNGGKGQVIEGMVTEGANSTASTDLPGWYEGEILFKRVIPIPGTGKFQYQDTHFKARCKAHNPQECYDRIVEHLRSRQDVDMRSQFPSIKGKNFTCSYLGMNLEQEG
ncbi:MAG: hypothetical protein IIX35_04370 [Paraprevotella sp.]|jgi:hypothetical protein|nr:hypothetical protein [Paraprevotella sp.]